MPGSAVTLSSSILRKTVKASDILSAATLSSANRVSGNKAYYDNDIVDITGTLQEILSCGYLDNAYGVYAKPVDVADCTAQYIKGVGWVGCLGMLYNTTMFNNLPVAGLGVGQAYVYVSLTGSTTKYLYTASGWLREQSTSTNGTTLTQILAGAVPPTGTVARPSLSISGGEDHGAGLVKGGEA